MKGFWLLVFLFSFFVSFGQTTISCVENKALFGRQCEGCPQGIGYELFSGLDVKRGRIHTYIRKPYNAYFRGQTVLLVGAKGNEIEVRLSSLPQFATMQEFRQYVSDCNYSIDSRLAYPTAVGDSIVYWVINSVGDTLGYEILEGGLPFAGVQNTSTIQMNIADDTLSSTLRQQSATSGQILEWSGSAWIPADNDDDTTNELITSYSISNDTISLIDPGGTYKINLKPYLDNQTVDTFEIVGNIIRLSLIDDGEAFQSVDLSGYLDNTDDQVFDVSSLTDDTLRLSIESDSEATKVFDLKPYLDNQTVDTFTLDGNTLRLALEDDGEAAYEVDLAGYVSTDDQIIDTFRLNSNTLELSLESDGVAVETVDFSSYLDNTDDQTFDVSTLTNDIISLSLESDGEATKTFDLSPYRQTVDTFSLDGNTLRLTLSEDQEAPYEVDLSGYVSTDDQIFDVSTLTGDVLSLSLEDDSEATKTFDLSPYRQTADTFALDGNTLRLALSGDNEAPYDVDLSGYLDNTDDQTIDVFTITADVLNASLEDDSEANKTADLSVYRQTIDTFEINSNTLRLSLSADQEVFQTVDLSSYLDNTDDQIFDVSSLTDDTLRLSIESDAEATKVFDLKPYVNEVTSVNSETGAVALDLALATNTLSLTGDGTTVDLSGYLDNTDDQTIDTFELVGNELRLSVESDAEAFQAVDLSGYVSTDDQVFDVSTLTDDTLRLSIEDDSEATKVFDLKPYLDNVFDGSGAPNEVAYFLDANTLTSSSNFTVNGTYDFDVTGTIRSTSHTYVDGSLYVYGPTPSIRISDTDIPQIWRIFQTSTGFYIEPETSDGTFFIRNQANSEILSLITSTGKLALPTYGLGNNSGTLAFPAGFTNTGGMIEPTAAEFSTWLGSEILDGTGSANRIAYWTDANTLTNSSTLTTNGSRAGIGGAVGADALSIYQDADEKGLKIFGYDDQSAEYLSLYESASGNAVFYSTGQFTISNPATENIVFDAGGNMFFDVGSSSYDMYFRDGAGATLMRIDGSGEVGIATNPVANQLLTIEKAVSGDGVTKYGQFNKLTRTETITGNTATYGIYSEVEHTITESAVNNDIYAGYFNADAKSDFRGNYAIQATATSSGSGTEHEWQRAINGTSYNNGTGTISIADGGYFVVQSGSTGTINSASGFTAYVQTASSGTIGTAYGVFAQTRALGGPITTGYGGKFVAEDATTNYGLHLVSTEGTNNWGIYVATADKNYFDGSMTWIDYGDDTHTGTLARLIGAEADGDLIDIDASDLSTYLNTDWSLTSNFIPYWTGSAFQNSPLETDGTGLAVQSSNVILSASGVVSTITGTNNFVLGASAMGSGNNTGASNVAIGLNSMYGHIGGSNNISIGSQSGYALAGTTDANGNINLGQNSGYSITTGDFNNNMGVSAGYSNTTGSSNNNYGNRAGYSNIGGTYNNNFGYYAGYDGQGSNNNNFGREAGRNITTGTGNNFFGYRVAYNTSDTVSNYSTGIGYRALETASEMNRAIAIGYEAGLTNAYSTVMLLGDNVENAYDNNQIIIGGSDYHETYLEGGDLYVTNYGSGNNTGTVAYNLEVTSAGLVIETSDAYAEMYISTNQTESITSGTPVEETTWTSGELSNFTHSSGRLTYTGTATIKVQVNTTISFSYSVGNTVVDSWVYENGAEVTKSEFNRKIGSGGDVGNGGHSCILELATNDYIEIFFDADDNGTITIENANVNVTKI